MRLQFLIAVAMLVSGCATVNYNYEGQVCDVLGFSRNNKNVLLQCPSGEVRIMNREGRQ